MRRSPLSSNQIRHSFSLSQSHLSVQICPASEFARFRRTHASLDEQMQHIVHYILGSMTRNLHRILPGIRMRSPEHGHQHLIQQLPVIQKNPSEPYRIPGSHHDLTSRHTLHHRRNHRQRLSPTHPDHGNRPRTRNSSRSTNRIVIHQIHIHNQFIFNHFRIA